VTTYLGFDVLDQVMHNRRDSTEVRSDRGFDVLDNATGLRDSWIRTHAAAPARPFLWTCFTRAQAAALRAFILARRGRAVPFWVPSYQQDLRLSSDVSAGASGLNIRWIGYQRHLFGDGGWRRHLALYDQHLQLELHKVTAAADPNDYITESLTLSAPLAHNWAAATTIVSFLHLCRLDEDGAKLSWRGQTAEAQLTFRELPLEAPV